MMIKRRYFLFDQGIAGHFEKVLAKNKYDLQVLRVAIEEYDFQSSASRPFSPENKLCYGEKLKIVFDSVVNCQSYDETLTLFNMALLLISLTVSLTGAAGSEVASEMLVSAFISIILTCVLALLFLLLRMRARVIRTRLFDALLVLRSEIDQL